MSGEEMNNQSVDELAREMEERALDIKIVAALERAPEVSASIPADFAARVAASVPLRRAVAVTPSRWGRTMMWMSLAVSLAVLVFVAAARAEQSVAVTTVVWTLYLESLAIAVWLGVRRWRAN
jgi:hypothetical protein